MKNSNDTNSTRLGGVIFQEEVICVRLEYQMNIQVLPFYGWHPSDLPISKATLSSMYDHAKLWLILSGPREQEMVEFYVHMTVHHNKFLYNKTNRRTNFQIYSDMKFYMFRAVPLLIIRSFLPYIRHWHMLYRSADS